MRLLYFIFFACISPLIYSQQPPHLNFTNYSLEKIPGTYKARMVQDKFGYLWFPSADGLYRYDGVELKHYYHIASDTNSLSLNSVACVYADEDGSIWVGTFDGGLDHLDPATGKCKIYKYDKTNIHSISGNRILCVFRDSKKRLWISAAGNEAGLNIFNQQQNNFERIQLGESSLSSSQKAANNTINFLNEMQNGNLIASTYDGLWIRDDATGTFSVYRCDTNASRLRNNLMGVTLEYPANTIWICTWGGGLKRFDFISKTFQTYLWNNKIKNSGFTNIAHDIVLKDSNELWLASVDKGFGVFDFSTKNFQFFPSSDFKYNTENYGAYNLFKEKNKNVWVGLDNYTCARLDIDKQPLPFTTMVKQSPGYTIPEISSVIKTNNAHYVLTTSWVNGIFTLNEATNHLTAITIPDGKKAESVNLIKDHTGKIWAICNKLYFIDEMKSTLIPFQPLNNNAFKLYEGIEDSYHNFWFTTSDGIICYTNDAHSILHYTSAQLGLKFSSRLHGLICDDKDNVWVGSDENGLFIFDASSKKFKNIKGNDLPFNTITDFTKDDKNRIWMCGIGGIAVCINQTPLPQFKSFSFEDGLGTNNITNIDYDYQHSIWAIGSGNVVRINTNDFSIDNLDKSIFSGKTIVSVSVDSNRLFLGAATGFFKFFPADIHSDTTQPTIVLNSFKIFDNEYPLHDLTKAIRLRYNQNYFSFDFAAICFSNGDKCKYAYKLEGFDKDWIDAGNRRYAAYTNIPGGNYVFKVKGANADGLWNNTGISIPIFITTPFWKTWWFYFSLAIFISIVIYQFYRYRINQLLKMQKMRAQIASDLHDDIGSTLTSISFYSEMVKMQLNNHADSMSQNILEKIGSNARNMVSAMSDIVWVINPANDVTENLVAKMKSHAAQLLSERNIHLNFKSDEFKKIKLTMLQKKNIYLIYKEALHNAVKYSGCNVIEIQFAQQHHQIHFWLKDNGKGFKITEQLNGNGLQNMKQRAKDLHGNLVIDTKPGDGTSINLYIKIT